MVLSNHMIKLEENEEIKKVIRRHWFVMLPNILVLFISALAPALAYYFFLNSGFFPLDTSVKDIIENFVSRWQLFAYSLWLLALWIVFFIEWTDYYLDLWVVTDRRILDAEQKGFFHREVTSFSYRQIQDITVETRGILETFLKFGTLHIQTAGHDRDIVIKDAIDPEGARSLVLELSRRHELLGDK